MTTMWRRCSFVLGLALIGTSFLVPTLRAGAAIGPVATTTTTVSYSCRGVGFAFGIGTLPSQNVTVTLGAPTTVTPGQQYVVTVDMTPLRLADAGFPIDAPAHTALNPVGGTGTSGNQAVSPNVVFSGVTATVPRSLMTVSPTAPVGGSVNLRAGTIQIVIGSTGFACDPVSGATPATISTAIIADTTTTTASTTTSSTVPGQTTVSTSSTTTASTTTVPVTAPPPTTAPTTAPPTTAAPTTAAPTTQTPTPTTEPVATVPGSQAATTVRSAASATFTCNIYDAGGVKFNQNPLPDSNVTITITHPDKVGVGGQIAGLVRFDPGPLNGPIRLNAGTVNFAALLSVDGAAPASVEATGGPNATEVAPNSASRSPEMPFRVTSSAPAGSQVRIGVTQVEARASSPSVLITRCTPQGTAMASVASVAVVAGAVTASPDLAAEVESAAATGGSSSGGSGTAARDGYATCAEAKAAGRGTIVKTDPAYRTWLDGDNDGLACEKGEGLGTALASTGVSSNSTFSLSLLLFAAGLCCTLAGRVRRSRTADVVADAG